jgi:hypothetical protein
VLNGGGDCRGGSIELFGPFLVCCRGPPPQWWWAHTGSAILTFIILDLGCLVFAGWKRRKVGGLVKWSVPIGTSDCFVPI